MHRWTTIAALTAAAVSMQLTPATARADLHNITYIARVDAVAPGSLATFVTNDNQTNTAAVEFDARQRISGQHGQLVRPVPGSADPMNGVLPCGAPLPNP